MKKGTRNKALITLVVAILGMTFLVYSVLANGNEDKWVDEVLHDQQAQQAWIGKKVRVLGYVEPGTLKKQTHDQMPLATFVIERNGKRIPIEYVGDVPDTLTDHAETAALGHMEDRHGQIVFVATEVSAKCPSKYEGADSNRSLAVKPTYQ